MTSPGIPHAHVFGVILAMLGTAGPVAANAAARDEPTAKFAIRSGSHRDFGRLVVDTNGKATYQLEQDGDRVVVRFGRGVTLREPPGLPRNMIAIKIYGSTVDLTLKHGAKLSVKQMRGRAIFDALDGSDDPAPASGPDGPAPASPPQQSEIPRPDSRSRPPLTMALSPELGGRSMVAASAPPAAPRVQVAAQTLPPPAQPAAAPASPARQAADQPAVEPAQQTPPGRDVLPENEGPVGLMARRVKLPKDMDGSAFLVPFDSTTGAAAFRGSDSTYVVFDERRPVDMRALRDDAVFGATSVQLLPGGTLFRIPLSQARTIALTQMQTGWRVAALAAAPKQQPVTVSNADGRLSLAAEQSGDVVNLADPDTGATLLVGTQHRPGQGIVTNRLTAEFILRPTIQGVVVEPLSDAIAIKAAPTGFILTGGPAGLALSPPASATDGLMDAALLTRRFTLPTIPTEVLLRREIRQIGEAAASPPQARGHKNHIAAESLVALGLAVEGESLLHVAAEQDPKEAASIDTAALTAIAALLAGRPEEADALSDPRLDGTDEISLWRAIRQAMLDDGSPSAAAVFSATAPLAFQYPAPTREHILPLIVETMIKGGEIPAAARLLDQSKADPRLAFARALMKQAEGDTGQALSMLDTLASGHDQFDRARASIRAVELRLAAGKLDKTQAAEALDKLLYAWRGDSRELALRERIADLRGQTGAWRVALATLRQAETDFPEQATAIHDRLKDMFAGMSRDQGERQVPPIDFVATVDENADLASGASDDEAVEQLLADRLLALDLPERAKPVLEKLIRSAKTGIAKARFGASLAALQSHEGDNASARAVLEGSEGKDLPPDLVERRMILKANAVARLGDAAAGAALLIPLRTVSATEARAQILENASDWAGAEQAWSDCVAVALPEAGMLDDAQTRTLLRLATAAARAGDDAGLMELRAKYGSRIGATPLGDMIRLLTVQPIRTSADIKRSQQEVSLAASLPGGLKALQAGALAR